MSVQLVGVARPATVRLAQQHRFRGVRRVWGELPSDDEDQALDEQSFRRALIDCQPGADRKPGELCLDCPRLLAFTHGVRASEVVVSCAWAHFDPVSARMTAAPALVHVTPAISCDTAARLAAREGVRRLLVLEDQRLVGVVSKRDLAAGGDAPVSSVMSSDVFAIASSASLGEAASAMKALNVGCLPVVRDAWLVGIISRGDLIRSGVSPAVFR